VFKIFPAFRQTFFLSANWIRKGRYLKSRSCLCLSQWFSNWVPRSFWGPRSTFQKNQHESESAFSAPGLLSIKPTARNRLDAIHDMRVALSKTEPNIADLIAQKQVHPSHWCNKKTTCCFVFICVDFWRGPWAIKKIARGPLRNF